MGNTTKHGILCHMENALKHSPKKKGAILSLETMLYIGILIIFAAIGIGMYNQRDSAKAAAARTEMDQIRTAVTQYNMYSNSEYTDANFDALLSKLSADDSIDGLEHGPFLTQRSASGLILWPLLLGRLLRPGHIHGRRAASGLRALLTRGASSTPMIPQRARSRARARILI